MSFKVRFENGKTAVFETQPSPEDIEEVASTFEAAPSTSTANINTGDLASSTVEQKAGEVPTKEYFKSVGRGAIKGATFQDLTQAESETPGMQLGAHAGGILPMVAADAVVPGGGAPLARAAMTGMVYGASKSAVNRKPLLEGVKETGVQGLNFLAAHGAGKLASKIFNPFSGSVTPALEAGRKAAESVGIKPPVSSLTENPGVQGAERVLEYTPFGQAITRMRIKALDGLRSYAGKVGRMIGKDQDPTFTGNVAKQELENFYDRFNQTKDKIYDSVLPQLRKKAVDLENTIFTLKDIIKRRSGEAEPAGLNQVRKWLKNIQDREVGTGLLDSQGKEIMKVIPGTIKTFEKLRSFRTNVGARGKWNDPAISGLMADLKDVYRAISMDLDNAASKVPGAAESLAKADEFFQQGKLTLKSKVFNALRTVAPENVHKVVLVPNSPSQYEIGKEILGTEMPGVIRQWFDNIIKLEPDGSISPAKIASRLSRYGSTIEAIAKDHPAVGKELAKLQQIAALLTKGTKVTQGSQSAYLASVFASGFTLVQRLLTGDLKGAAATAGTIGATGAGVAGLTSDAGREYLTRGFPKVGAAAGKVVEKAGQLVASRMGATERDKAKTKIEEKAKGYVKK